MNYKYCVSMLVIAELLMVPHQTQAIDLSVLLGKKNTPIKDVQQPKTQPTGIDLSSLMSDHGDANTKVEKPVNFIDLSSFVDPDYQKALALLNDPQNTKIYENYLRSIQQSFMQYYLLKNKVAKKTVTKSTLDLSVLEKLSNQPSVTKLTANLSSPDLSSLVKISQVPVLKKDTPTTSLDLSALLENRSTIAPAAIQKTAPSGRVNLSALLQSGNQAATATKNTAG